MAGNGARYGDKGDAAAAVRRLHELVTWGPWHLDVASAMAVHGYDAVKWAEGQGILAELVSCAAPAAATLDAALAWYEEAATAAQQALTAQPELLAKLGLNGQVSPLPI